jgi:hypothetical protein
MGGYELRPVVIDGPAGRAPLALTVVAGLVASMLVIKPWSAVFGLFDAPHAAVAPRAATAAVPAVPPSASAASASEAPGLGSLARHAGTWGVGASGHRANAAEPWVRWTAVAPSQAASASATPAGPSGGLCDRVPTLPTDALFIAVSNETDVPIDRHVTAWWWDRGTATPLPAIHQVTPPGDRGIAYVVRDDGMAWAAGRYVFRLVAGDDAVDLVVCLATGP